MLIFTPIQNQTFPHFTDEGSEAHCGQVSCPCSLLVHSQDSRCLTLESVHINTVLTGTVSVDGEPHLGQPPKYLCGPCPVPGNSITGQSRPPQGTEGRLTEGLQKSLARLCVICWDSALFERGFI